MYIYFIVIVARYYYLSTMKLLMYDLVNLKKKTKTKLYYPYYIIMFSIYRVSNNDSDKCNVIKVILCYYGCICRISYPLRA